MRAGDPRLERASWEDEEAMREARASPAASGEGAGVPEGRKGIRVLGRPGFRHNLPSEETSAAPTPKIYPLHTRVHTSQDGALTAWLRLWSGAWFRDDLKGQDHAPGCATDPQAGRRARSVCVLNEESRAEISASNPPDTPTPPKTRQNTPPAPWLPVAHVRPGPDLGRV